MGISPQDVADFARRMAPLGPFEKSPHIAVAVSGGADSMALALLGHQWARDSGGRMTALSVDHGLRAGSDHEAEQVGRWLEALGIEHRVLTWGGVKPGSGVQAAAREARYSLMAATCRQAGIFHLLCAHHQEDQAETFLLRLARSSGIDGLAAMSPILETDGIRLLRPLLEMPKSRLRGVLTGQGQAWIEDPSNDNTAFARVRIRKALPGIAATGMSVAVLAQTAARMARARVALEAAASNLLGSTAFVHPSGYLRLDGQTLFAAPEEISLRALSRSLMCVGGEVYPSSVQKVENLHEKMKTQFFGDSGWKGATLARCRVTPGPGGTFHVFREMRNLPVPMMLPDCARLNWDQRFDLRLNRLPKKRTGRKFQSDHNTLSLAPLGRQGLQDICAASDVPWVRALPKPVLWTLPALFDEAGVVHAPHLGYTRIDWANRGCGIDRAAFSPQQSLSGAGFAIAE